MRGALIDAQKTDNPQEYLQSIKSITLQDIIYLLDRRFSPNFPPDEKHPQHPVWCDVINYRDDPSCSAESIRCKFLYFATCITHCWGSWKNGEFYMDIKNSIASYAGPNAPVPHVWLHWDENKILVMVKHTFRDTDNPFKISIITTSGTTKLAYDLTTTSPIMSSGKGSFLEVVIKEHGPMIYSSGATAFGDFIVIITMGNRFLLQHVYLNDRTHKKIHEVAIIAHDVRNKNSMDPPYQ